MYFSEASAPVWIDLMFLSVLRWAVRKIKAEYLKHSISEHKLLRGPLGGFCYFIWHVNNVRLFHLYITGRLSGWTGTAGACLVVLGPVVGQRDPSSDRQGSPPTCLWMHREAFQEPKRWVACSLPSQKPVLTFGNFGTCTVVCLPRPEICIKRLRKIYPKINMKAKTSCQELQPHTSCWLLLLPLSSQFWFF